MRKVPARLMLFQTGNNGFTYETRTLPNPGRILAVDLGASVGSITATGRTVWVAVMLGTYHSSMANYGAATAQDHWICGVCGQSSLEAGGYLQVGQLNKFAGPLNIPFNRNEMVALVISTGDSQVVRATAVVHVEYYL